MSDYKPPAISRTAVDFETEHALRDVQANINERGHQLRFYEMDESTIDRSRYNSIKAHDLTPTITSVYAFPIDYNPSAFTLEKVGLSEDTEAILYTPMQSWIEEGYDIEGIDMVRWRVAVDGHEYEIKDKKEYGQYGTTYLYIVLGVKAI